MLSVVLSVETGALPMGAALISIFLRRRAALTRAIARIVGDRQVAEDLAQETYIRACRAEERSPITHIEAFLHQTARNLALDHLRRRGVRLGIEGAAPEDLSAVAQDAPTPEERLAGRQVFDQLMAALGQLPPRAQSVLILARLENWTNRRIAEHLEVSERTVFNDLKLALAHCRDALARSGWP